MQPLAVLNFFLLIYKLSNSGLQLIHYILELSRYINIVYIGEYLILTYIEKRFSFVCFFFSYICWSVNCMSWLSKFHDYFLTCSETEARFMFEDFKCYHSWKVQFHLSSLFSAFFIWSVNCSSHLFSLFLLISKLILWVESLVPKMFRSLSINLYLRPFSISVYGKFDSYSLYLFRLFLICKLCKSDLQIMPLDL